MADVRPELTEDDLAEIRLRRGGGATITRIAARFGVGRACIEAIVLGKAWRHLVAEKAAGDLFDGRER
jgi:hypothetical protein